MVILQLVIWLICESCLDQEKCNHIEYTHVGMYLEFIHDSFERSMCHAFSGLLNIERFIMQREKHPSRNGVSQLLPYILRDLQQSSVVWMKVEQLIREVLLIDTSAVKTLKMNTYLPSNAKRYIPLPPTISSLFAECTDAQCSTSTEYSLSCRKEQKISRPG